GDAAQQPNPRRWKTLRKSFVGAVYDRRALSVSMVLDGAHRAPLQFFRNFRTPPSSQKRSGSRFQPSRPSLESEVYFTPPPTAFAMAASCWRAFSRASPMLKLDGFWRGGNSLKVLRNSATMAWAGTRRNMRSADHF